MLKLWWIVNVCNDTKWGGEGVVGCITPFRECFSKIAFDWSDPESFFKSLLSFSSSVAQLMRVSCALSAIEISQQLLNRVVFSPPKPNEFRLDAVTNFLHSSLYWGWLYVSVCYSSHFVPQIRFDATWLELCTKALYELYLDWINSPH